MSTKLEKCLVKTAALIGFIYFVVHFTFSSNLQKLLSTPPFNPNITLNLSRSSLYWNTVDVNYLDVEDFRQTFSTNESNLSASENLKLRIIRAEQSWRLSTLDVKHPINTKKFNEPLFSCPHSLVFLQRKCICGLELYTTQPKPEECTVVRIGDSDGTFEKEWLSQTNCRVVIFQNSKNKQTDGALSEMLSMQWNLPRKTLIVNGSGTKGNDLLTIMHSYEVGWVDLLLVQINGANELSFLQNILKSATQVLPFAQLLLEIHIGESERLNDIIKKLENQGMRPFHKGPLKRADGHDKLNSTSCTMSFLNLRGKHLLLVGEE